MFGAPDSATTTSMRIPSIVMLGADALIAALPATPIQLAHACALVGYQHVVPASWGDELVAAATLRTLHSRDAKPAIQCSCPFVAHRLLAVGSDLRPFLVSLVAPPVVLARYLRAIAGETKLRITYVGRCPGAADEVIDARLTPEELLAIFADHQVVINDQPQVFDSVIPPDRRRYRSQPGGLPTPEMLWSANGNGGVTRALVELHGDDLPVELAQQLLAGRPMLIDVAPKLGCVCSGASNGVNPAEARSSVTALEPPRAGRPVVDESVLTDATLPLPASPRNAIDVVSPPTHIGGPYTPLTPSPNDPMFADVQENGAPGSPAARSDLGAVGAPHASAPSRRHSPPRGIARTLGGALPTARDADGRQLPRTYVARRRSPSRVTRHTPADAVSVISKEPEGGPSPRPAPNDQPAESVATVATMPEQPAAPAPVSDTGSTSADDPSIRHASTGESLGLATVIPAVTRATDDLLVYRPPRSEPPAWPSDDAVENGGRYSERAVALPVTPLSDSRRRDESPPNASGARPVMQVLTVGLSIALIVLVSVAVGVLVGRWMSQH